MLQQQEVRRVGESFSRKVDVRIVSAVNRDMRAEADAGRFRHDLLYRLDVIRNRVPEIGAPLPLLLLVAGGVILLTAISAAAVPARRAAGVNPTEALRAE